MAAEINQQQSPFRHRRRARKGDKAGGLWAECLQASFLFPSLIHSTPVSWRHTEKQRLFEKKMEAKRSYTKAVLAFSIASLLIGVFAVLDACLLPITWQHCHGDRGLSNHLCNDPYSPEGRRRDAGAEGEEVGMKAEPAKQRKGGRRGKREGASEGGGMGGGDRAEQQGPRQKQKEKKTDFLSPSSRERTFL